MATFEAQVKLKGIASKQTVRVEATGMVSVKQAIQAKYSPGQIESISNIKKVG